MQKPGWCYPAGSQWSRIQSLTGLEGGRKSGLHSQNCACGWGVSGREMRLIDELTKEETGEKEWVQHNTLEEGDGILECRRKSGKEEMLRALSLKRQRGLAIQNNDKSYTLPVSSAFPDPTQNVDRATIRIQQWSVIGNQQISGNPTSLEIRHTSGSKTTRAEVVWPQRVCGGHSDRQWRLAGTRNSSSRDRWTQTHMPGANDQIYLVQLFSQ